MKKGILIVLLLAAILSAQEWTVNLGVIQGDMEDTVFVSFGVASTATDDFDASMDIVFPMAPPSGMYAYFPIDAPDHPGISMLGRDIRSSHASSHDWELHIDRDMTGLPTRIEWDMETLPMSELLELATSMEIAAQYPGIEVEDWIDMSSVGSIDIGAGMIVYLHVELATETAVAPEITFIHPEDGDVDVSTMEPLRFHIENEESGVDISSLLLIIDGDTIAHGDMSFSEIEYGYEVQYIPEGNWLYSDVINGTIIASDMSDPAEWMEPFEFSFSIETEGEDEEPPYFELLSISEVERFEPIYINVIDEGSQVDVESIELYIDGEVYEDYTATLYEGEPPYYSLTIEPPLYGWESCSELEIEVYACDDQDEPNCGEDEFVVDIVCDEFPEWAFLLDIWTALGGDTTNNTISFGLSDDATWRYDPGVDIAMTLPLFSSFGYLDIEDPATPYVTKLQKDMKAPASTVTWLIKYNNPRDICGVNWSLENLMDLEDMLGGRFRIGYGPDASHMSWNDMRRRSGIQFDPEDDVHVKFSFGTVDTLPPFVQNIMPHPDSIELGLPGESTISFDVVDLMNGINPSTFELWVEDEMVSSEYIDETLLSDGIHYEYNAPEPFDFGTYDIMVHICDYNLPVANCTDITWTYEFIPCLDELNVELHLADTDAEGDTTGRGYLVFGAAPGAEIGRDDHDEPTFRPPTGTFFYFPIEDAVYDHLGVDIRPACAGGQLWRIGAEAVSGGHLKVNWDSSDIPPSDRWTIGIGSSPIGAGVPDDSEFYDMSTMENFSYTGGEVCYIKTLDTPSYCAIGYVEAEMADESTEVSITCIERDLTVSVFAGDSFQICGLMDGTYSFLYESDGYVSHTIRDIIIDGEDAHICPVVLERQLANVEGIVLIDDMPIEGITVTIGEESSVTDSGQYRIEGLYPGEYDICLIDLPGCLPDTCVSIDISAGDNLIDLFLTQPRYRITGNASFGGEAMEGIEISWCDSDSAITITDVEGDYLIDGLTCGEYCLRFTTEDGAEIDTSIYLDDDLVLDVDIPSLYFSIAGIVTNDCGREDAAVRVLLTFLEDSARTTEIDSSGYFEFSSLLNGEYFIKVQTDYMTEWAESLVLDGEDIELDIELACLLPVIGLDVEGQEVERPYEPGDFNITVSWMISPSVPEIDSFVVLRSSTDFELPYEAERIARVVYPTMEYIDTDIEPFTEYFYAVIPYYSSVPHLGMMGEVESDMAEVHPDQSTILIVDWDDSATPLDGLGAEIGIADILDNPSLDYTGEYTVTPQNISSFEGYQLSDYSSIFIVLGINDDENPVMPVSMVEALIAYSEEAEGGMIYIEGPDVGNLFRTVGGVHRDFLESFGIRWIPMYDGEPETEGNVETLEMAGSFFGEDFTAPYLYMSLADRSVDYFTLITAEEVMRSQDGNIRGAMRMLSSDVKMIVSSVYLGAIGDMNTKVRIMGRYLEVDDIDEAELRPDHKSLLSIYPNPFNSSSEVNFEIQQDSQIEISLLTLDGRRIMNIADAFYNKGNHSVRIDAKGIPTGSYLVVMRQNGMITSERAILVK